MCMKRFVRGNSYHKTITIQLQKTRSPLSGPINCTKSPHQIVSDCIRDSISKQMSLGLHAHQLPTPGPDFLSRVCVFEPQHVGDQRRVAQQQELRHSPKFTNHH